MADYIPASYNLILVLMC